MSASSDELPMAPAGCTLTNGGLVEQLERYRRLGTSAVRITRRDLGLMVWFDSAVDVALLTETIAVERDCCGFFTVDYDDSERRLSITVDGPARRDALDALASALGARPRLSAERRSR